MLLAKGESQTSAFRLAFPQCAKWLPRTITKRASELARRGDVAGRFRELLAKAATANEADIALVLAQYLKRLMADPRELTEIRVNPCRYCWGAGHLYQFTDGELRQAEIKHEAKREAGLEQASPRDIGNFDPQGGGGYSVLKGPYDECPSCGGAGVPQVVLKDSRHYSEGAALLFAGVKEGKEGIEVKIADRNDALAQIARHVSFFEADNKVDVNLTVDADALDAIYDESLIKAKAGEAYAKRRMDRLREK